jgi:hypothetical protein
MPTRWRIVDLHSLAVGPDIATTPSPLRASTIAIMVHGVDRAGDDPVIPPAGVHISFAQVTTQAGVAFMKLPLGRPA